MKRINTKNEKGFVALFTVLIAVVVLSMAIGIANIAFKQILLASSATEADKAFYAADSGVECALLFEIGNVDYPSTVTCGDYVNAPVTSSPSQNGEMNIFEINYTLPSGEQTCALVEVLIEPSPFNSITIESFGENRACTETPGNKTVQRAIRVRYQRALVN